MKLWLKSQKIPISFVLEFEIICRLELLVKCAMGRMLIKSRSGMSEKDKRMDVCVDLGSLKNCSC